MKLTDQEKLQAKSKGAMVSDKCDACGRVLNYLRYTIKDDNREFCTAAERDKCFYTQAELDKATKGGSCIHCKGPKEETNRPYCSTCNSVADPAGILTGKAKKTKKLVEASGGGEKPKDTVRINRRTRTTKKVNRKTRTLESNRE